MKKSELIKIIKEEIHNILKEKLSSDSASNLHGDDRTQRQFVADLAKKLGGYITLSDIADALGMTNMDVKDSYGRLIRYFNTKNNEFQKVVPEVPFRSAAIYQYVGADRSEKQVDLAAKKEQEEINFKKALPYYYNIRKYTPGKGLQTVAYLRLRQDDDINQYVRMLPKTDKYDLTTSPFADNPGKKYKIINSTQFEELCNKLKSNDSTTFENKKI